MSIIKLENLEFFSFHGHYPEEKLVGNDFLINVKLKTNTEKAQKSDDLKDTLDYQLVHQIIKELMEEPVNLLEHLADKIITKLFATFNSLEYAKIKVSKMNPPMGGKMEAVSVTLKQKRKK